MSTRWGWLFGIVLTAASGSSNCAQAQIVPDRTQGTEASRLTPNVLVNGAAAYFKETYSLSIKSGGNCACDWLGSQRQWRSDADLE